MEHKKISLLDDTTIQPSKFRTRHWVEVKDESRGTHNVSNQIKFKTSTIRSNICNYSDGYIHVKGTISVPQQHKAQIQIKQYLKLCSNY